MWRGVVDTDKAAQRVVVKVDKVAWIESIKDVRATQRSTVKACIVAQRGASEADRAVQQSTVKTVVKAVAKAVRDARCGFWSPWQLGAVDDDRESRHSEGSQGSVARLSVGCSSG